MVSLYKLVYSILIVVYTEVKINLPIDVTKTTTVFVHHRQVIYHL